MRVEGHPHLDKTQASVVNIDDEGYSTFMSQHYERIQNQARMFNLEQRFEEQAKLISKLLEILDGSANNNA
jgi:hypothetical protein